MTPSVSFCNLCVTKSPPITVFGGLGRRSTGSLSVSQITSSVGIIMIVTNIFTNGPWHKTTSSFPLVCVYRSRNKTPEGYWESYFRVVEVDWVFGVGLERRLIERPREGVTSIVRGRRRCLREDCDRRTFVERQKLVSRTHSEGDTETGRGGPFWLTKYEPEGVNGRSRGKKTVGKNPFPPSRTAEGGERCPTTVVRPEHRIRGLKPDLTV